MNATTTLANSVPAIQDLKFCDWVQWHQRPDLLQHDGPWLGVYLWARFYGPPKPFNEYPDLPKEIIYIGEAKNIDSRPLSGNHHRLAHYRDTFPDDPKLAKLYISVCRVRRFADGFDSKKARGMYARLRIYTEWIEASLYWEYTKVWNRPPALHYKKGTYGH
jgi:hypothetical protein